MISFIRSIIFEYGPWVMLIPFLISILRYKYFQAEFKTITFYMILSVITQIISYIFWRYKKNNLPILHLYTIVEFLIILNFFFEIHKGFLSQKFFLVTAIVFPILSVINSVWIQNIYTFNTYSRSLEALLFIFLSVSWFISEVSQFEEKKTNSLALRYIVSGFLIYFTGSIVLFSFDNEINKLIAEYVLNIWFIHTTLLMFLYLLITVGLWKQKRT